MIFDLHTHTCLSYDGFTTPAELVAACHIRGINAVAITDHDRISSPVSELFATQGIEFIPGCEYTDHTGAHIIGLFVQQSLPFGSRAELILSHIHAEGGFCVMPHPWKPGSGYMVMNGNLDLLPQFHFIELINGGWRAQAHASDILALASAFDLRLLASSDSHKACQVGLCCTRINHPSSTIRAYDVLSNATQKDMDLLIDSFLLERLGRRSNALQKSNPYQVLLPCIPYSLRRVARLFHYRCSSQRFAQSGSLSAVEVTTSPW